MDRYLENSLDISLMDLLEIMQAKVLGSTYYFGIQTLKFPIDFWIYQEILFETRPDVVIEIGNYKGGSTLAIAHILDNLNHGKIIAIDIDHSNISEVVIKHPRINLLTLNASSAFDRVKNLINQDDNVLIIDDSSHTFENTLDLLRKYSSLIKNGNYFIVEDGICHHGLDVGPNPGPFEAIEQFARENPDFEIDRTKEKFLITWNPKGFLRRK